MAIVWTEKQSEIIDSRDKTLLVSAAAGSGKTAVLVEHIISRICDEKAPACADRFLLVTFTNAAAAQMRERINKAIDERLDGLEENSDLYKYLGRQQMLLGNAQISTIHQFCLSIIRNHFNSIELDPAFRLADEGELKLIKSDVVSELLEECYKEGNRAFLGLVESICVGKNDDGFEDLILKIFEASQSHPMPDTWLDFCAKNYSITSVTEAEELVEFKKLLEQKDVMLGSLLKVWQKGYMEVMAEGGPVVYEAVYAGDREILEAVLRAKGYSDVVATWNLVKDGFATLPRVKKDAYPEEIVENVKAYRKIYKDELRKFMTAYFSVPLEELIGELGAVRENVELLVSLVKEFARMFAAKKRERNLVDFNDLEHFALEILTETDAEGNLKFTEVAREYSDYFAEVMVDEYQDSNLVQEVILTAVSGKYRGYEKLFMVGDVKQSIYKFRMARPDLFLTKYHSFTKGEKVGEKCIELSQNYRSRGEVLDSVNTVFDNIMRLDFGGINYSDGQQLNRGKDFEPEATGYDYTTEIMLLEQKTEDGDRADLETAEMEAKAVAARIKELVDNETGLPVWDEKRKEYRKAQYRDIVILLRSFAGRSDAYTKVLEEEGIPVFAQSNTGYFDAYEVSTVINYLRILDNPTQDISLAAVLHSPMGDFSSEELALIKIEAGNRSLYEGLTGYGEVGEVVALREKIADFLAIFKSLREKRFYTPMHKLIREVLKATGYGDYCAAMPAGKKRKMNLDMLIEKAKAFEATSYRGLFNFVRYIEKLKKYEVDYGEAVTSGEDDNTVRIMSIHKSKGLEFPVVILGGISKKFNQQDSAQKVVFHADYGIGMDIVDIKLRTKKNSLKRQVMQRMLRIENMEEEARVLYVAMTRAIDKLIMVGAFSSLDTKEKKWADDSEATFLSLTSAGCFADWIMPFTGGRGFKVKSISPDALISEEKERLLTDGARESFLRNKNKDEVVDADIRQLIEERFAYSYKQELSVGVHAAVSVSELKKLSYVCEDEDRNFLIEENEEVVPKFIAEDAKEETLGEAGDSGRSDNESKRLGMAVGTAYHTVMEHYDFANTPDKNAVKMLCERLALEGKIEGGAAKKMRMDTLLSFAGTKLYERMQKAELAGALRKEQPFVIGMDSGEVREDWPSGELIMVQGIIDAFFEEGGELVLVDYKTDRVPEAEDSYKMFANRYGKQMELYARALEQLTGKRVKEKIIYALGVGEEFLM